WVLPAAVLAVTTVLLVYVGRPSKPAAPAPAASVLTTSLRDAGTTIGLDGSGTFRGYEGIPASERDLLRQVLQSGMLPVPAEAAKLKRRRDVRLGAAAPSPVFEASDPTGTVVPEQRPRFRWNAPAGAQNFVVSVYTMSFEPVTKSGTLTTDEWTPDQAL